MIVVADSVPLHYLILLEHIELLRRFYGQVLVPEPVADELSAAVALAVVREWITKIQDETCFFLTVDFDKANWRDDAAAFLETCRDVAHEFAHELLHRSDDRPESRDTRELEAEAVAFVVGQAVGLEAAEDAPDYIQLYRGDATALAASLARIQRAASSILQSIQPGDKAISDAA